MIGKLITMITTFYNGHSSVAISLALYNRKLWKIGMLLEGNFQWAPAKAKKRPFFV
jgi:hypothetical protein